MDCRLIESPELDERGNIDISKRVEGDMWFLDIPTEELKDRHLTAQYFRDNSGRKPLVVLLPGGHYFLIDGQGYSEEKGYYDCWTVTGTPPKITVVPSINMVGKWHGFLTDGVLK